MFGVFGTLTSVLAGAAGGASAASGVFARFGATIAGLTGFLGRAIPLVGTFFLAWDFGKLIGSINIGTQSIEERVSRWIDVSDVKVPGEADALAAIRDCQALVAASEMIVAQTSGRLTPPQKMEFGRAMGHSGKAGERSLPRRDGSDAVDVLTRVVEALTGAIDDE